MTDVRVRYLEDVANVAAGDVVERPVSTAEWLADRGLVEILEDDAKPKRGRPAKDPTGGTPA